MGKMLKRQLNANFTLEAVVIILIFFITLAFFYLNFFLHDKNIFKANVNEIIQNYKENREEGLIENSYLTQKLKEGLWMSEVFKVSAELEGSNLEIRAVLGRTVSDEQVLHLFSVMGFNYTLTRKEAMFSRSEAARIFTVGSDTLEHIKGMNEILGSFLGK